MTSFFDKLLGRSSPCSDPLLGEGDDISVRQHDVFRFGDTPDDLHWEGEQLDYQEAKRLATSPDGFVRASLAERADVPPEILYYLADDPDPRVRRALVRNKATPALAHLILVEDIDELVRSDLAERIVRLAPGLTPDERDRARRTAYRVLETLARDQIPHVRQIIAESLKDVVDAPSEVINTLARDVEEAVSTPILQYSPVLRDEDLLDIITEKPSSAALSAISRRAQVAADVSDAIAATDDIEAIAVLLGNKSAQIREETLDSLIDQAPNRVSWHEPLVTRPNLHARAAERLAHFVADRLIGVLCDRHDFSEETVQEIKRAVHRRLEDERRDSIEATSSPRPQRSQAKTPCAIDDVSGWPQALADAFLHATTLNDRGALSQSDITQAVKDGDLDFVAAGLAVRAGLSPLVVLAAIRSGSSRGVAAMAWKAKMSQDIAVQIQARFNRVPPRELVKIAQECFGLTEAEMEWQVEMFTSIAEQGGG